MNLCIRPRNWTQEISIKGKTQEININKGVNCSAALVGVLQDNLVLSTGLIMCIGHCKEIRKLKFRALISPSSENINFVPRAFVTYVQRNRKTKPCGIMSISFPEPSLDEGNEGSGPGDWRNIRTFLESIVVLFHWTSLWRQLISIDLFLAWKKSIIIKPIVARTDTTPSKQPRIIDIVFWLQEATPRSEKQSKEFNVSSNRRKHCTYVFSFSSLWTFTFSLT